MTGRKKHDYPREIIEIFRKGNFGRSKSSIAHEIGGDRNQVFEEIQRLIAKQILYEEKRKLWMDFDSESSFEKSLVLFEGKLDLYSAMVFGDKKRLGLLKEIKNRLISSGKAMFYGEEVIVQGVKLEGEIHQMNPHVKSYLQAIREQIDILFRSSYAVFVRNMHNENKELTERFEKLQKRGLKMQIRTRQELWKMQVGDKTMYNEWDFMVFSGYDLELDVHDYRKMLDEDKKKRIKKRN